MRYISKVSKKFTSLSIVSHLEKTKRDILHPVYAWTNTTNIHANLTFINLKIGYRNLEKIFHKIHCRQETSIRKVINKIKVKYH